MIVRGIRGATTVENDTPEEILAATRELLSEILRTNAIESFEDVVSAIFTTTADLTSAFPAASARGMGMNQVPLLCSQEIPVPNSTPRCIRVLMHVNTERSQSEMVHIYLRGAKNLRPDVNCAQ